MSKANYHRLEINHSKRKPKRETIVPVHKHKKKVFSEQEKFNIIYDIVRKEEMISTQELLDKLTEEFFPITFLELKEIIPRNWWDYGIGSEKYDFDGTYGLIIYR